MPKNEAELSVIFSKVNAIDIEPKSSHTNFVNTQNIRDIKINEIYNKLTNHIYTIQKLDSVFIKINKKVPDNSPSNYLGVGSLTRNKNKIFEMEITKKYTHLKQ